MSEQELNKLIAKRITYYLDINKKSQQELATYLSVSQATVSNWCKGIKMPRMDKIDRICSYFSITRSDLMEDKANSNDTLSKLVLDSIQQLNSDNIYKVIKYAQNLLAIQQMEDEPVLMAAHHDNPTEEQQLKINKDMDILKRPT